MGLSVSELATRAGITPDTVRYYGRLGLLPETGRTAAGHRYYDDTALERLRFIKGAQWFELRLEEIRELLEVFDGKCARADTRGRWCCAASPPSTSSGPASMRSGRPCAVFWATKPPPRRPTATQEQGATT